MVQLLRVASAAAAGGRRRRIVTRGRGYELQLSDGVDAIRFERLLSEEARRRARRSRCGGAAAGRLADEPFAAAEIRRLDELWLRARETAIDGALAAGRHVDVLGELDELVARHPLREHLHAQHMLALYRSGRQSEALAAYRDARAGSSTRSGSSRGPSCGSLKDAILAPGPRLDGPPRRRLAAARRGGGPARPLRPLSPRSPRPPSLAVDRVRRDRRPRPDRREHRRA